MRATDKKKSGDVICYHYCFTFPDRTVKEFHIECNAKTLLIQKPPPHACPEWTKLSFCKCPHCPLDENIYKYCPIAVNLVELVTAFGGSLSFEQVEIFIETRARSYTKQTALSKGISSLIGIYMVTSGCPVMEKLKPMVRYHLPFATNEETTYRAVSMYLFAQYFISKSGGRPDWDLKNLLQIYDDVRTVNEYFCQRFADFRLQDGDANINAMVILDCLADSLQFSIHIDLLKDFVPLFRAYLD